MEYLRLTKDLKNNSKWKTYQCAVFIFTNSGNILHAIAASFSLSTSIFLRHFDKTNKFIILLMIGAEVIFLIITPFFASIFTHLIAGIFTYIWLSSPILGMAIFLFYKSNEMSLEFSRNTIILFLGVSISMVLTVLLIVTINNTQIKLYDDEDYMNSLTKTLIERKIVGYTTNLHTFDEIYSAIWLLL